MMPALEAGATAPNIGLTNTQGLPFSLDQARSAGPVVAAFFKVGCPTCQYAFPFFERIFKAYPQDKVSFVGVSQDSKSDTEAFAKRFGVTFPILLDDTKKYPASNAYGLTNVPATFLVSSAGRIEQSIVGWDKKEIVQLNQAVAKAAGAAPVQIFNAGENVLDFKAG
jgi:peroxiredoxin